MKAVVAGDITSHFPEILKEVKLGKQVGILYGRLSAPVAMIVPYTKKKKVERKIGILDGKMSIAFSDSFEMTAEELVSM